MKGYYFIADKLVELATSPVKMLMPSAVIRTVRRWGWRVLSRKRLTAVRSPYELQKFPGLGLRELRDILREFQNVTGRFAGIEIEEKWPECFELQEDCIRDRG